MNRADRIQYLRKSKGISQEELADKVGISRQLFLNGKVNKVRRTVGYFIERILSEEKASWE